MTQRIDPTRQRYPSVIADVSEVLEIGEWQIERLPGPVPSIRLTSPFGFGSWVYYDVSSGDDDHILWCLLQVLLKEVPLVLARVGELEQAVATMEARKDAAYLERNQVVVALAKCFPSGVARTAIEGWSEDWHGVVYVDLPTGQCSWHHHDSHSHLFEGLPAYTKPWDGHDTEEKYRRVAALPLPDLSTEDVEFEIRDREGEPYAGCSGPRESALREARHYVAMEPGSVVYEVTRRRIEL